MTTHENEDGHPVSAGDPCACGRTDTSPTAYFFDNDPDSEHGVAFSRAECARCEPYATPHGVLVRFCWDDCERTYPGYFSGDHWNGWPNIIMAEAAFMEMVASEGWVEDEDSGRFPEPHEDADGDRWIDLGNCYCPNLVGYGPPVPALERALLEAITTDDPDSPDAKLDFDADVLAKGLGLRAVRDDDNGHLVLQGPHGRGCFDHVTGWTGYEGQGSNPGLYDRGMAFADVVRLAGGGEWPARYLSAEVQGPTLCYCYESEEDGGRCRGPEVLAVIGRNDPYHSPPQTGGLERIRLCRQHALQPSPSGDGCNGTHLWLQGDADYADLVWMAPTSSDPLGPLDLDMAMDRAIPAMERNPEVQAALDDEANRCAGLFGLRMEEREADGYHVLRGPGGEAERDRGSWNVEAPDGTTLALLTTPAHMVELLQTERPPSGPSLDLWPEQYRHLRIDHDPTRCWYGNADGEGDFADGHVEALAPAVIHSPVSDEPERIMVCANCTPLPGHAGILDWMGEAALPLTLWPEEHRSLPFVGSPTECHCRWFAREEEGDPAAHGCPGGAPEVLLVYDNAPGVPYARTVVCDPCFQSYHRGGTLVWTGALPSTQPPSSPEPDPHPTEVNRDRVRALAEDFLSGPCGEAWETLSEHLRGYPCGFCGGHHWETIPYRPADRPGDTVVADCHLCISTVTADECVTPAAPCALCARVILGPTDGNNWFDYAVSPHFDDVCVDCGEDRRRQDEQSRNNRVASAEAALATLTPTERRLVLARFLDS